MMRTYATLVAFLSLLSTANAQQVGADINLQAFQPAMDSRGFVTVDSSQPLGHKELSFGLVTNWGKGVLKLSEGDNTYELTHVITPTLVAAGGLWIGKFPIEFGAAVPFPVVSGDRGPDSFGTAGPNDDQRFGFGGQGLGDISLHLKLRVARQDQLGLGVALIGSAFLPTASESAQWLGDESAGAQVKLVLDRQFSGFRVGTNIGYRQRIGGESEFTDQAMPGSLMPFTGQTVAVGSTIPFAAAVSWSVVPGKFELVGELFGAVAQGSENYQPLETLAGLKLYLGKNSFLTIGGGTGLARGQAGSPDVRAFMGIVFEPRHSDRDGDGLSDGEDFCPDDPEDFDDFADSDGCPEPNNDGDHLLDKDDQCPNRAEDMDGFADEDGCPEAQNTDSDGDGFANVHDKCPDDPEDFDGFEDNDGCPDVDNDGDKILDVDDLCPLLPEDVNGVDDEDGCPDRRGGAPIVKTKIVTLQRILFEFDSAVIKEESHKVIDQVIMTLLDNPDISSLEIQGHTDERGSRSYNQRLSQARAEAVVRYMVDAGIEATRLFAKGYGEDQPKVKGHGERVWWQNRRVEFVISKRNGE